MTDKIILVKEDKAVISTEKRLNRGDKEQLKKELDGSTMTPEAARATVLQEQVNNEISLYPFEVKQHFISKGDFGNARKADRVGTENPRQAVTKIKAEILFFGAAFLEGFLGVYGIKRDEARQSYENRLIIISEQQFETGERSAAICQVIRGRPKKIKDCKSIKEAHAQIQAMQPEPQQEKVIYGGLKNEITKKGE